MKRIVSFASALALVVALAPAADALQLTKGTMQLGGAATFDIDMTMPEVGDGETGFRLNVLPSVGYFLMDNLELVGTAGLGMGFGDLYDPSSTLVGFGVGAKYYMPVSNMFMYFGAQVGMGFIMPDQGDTLKNLVISIPIGLLFPLNEHVAMDFGTMITYNMGMDDQGSSLNVPIGYLGVQAFF